MMAGLVGAFESLPSRCPTVRRYLQGRAGVEVRFRLLQLAWQGKTALRRVVKRPAIGESNRCADGVV